VKKLSYNYKTGVVSIKPDDTDVFFVVAATVIKDHSLVYIAETNECALIIDLDCARILVKDVRVNEDALLTKFIKATTIKIKDGKIYF